MTTLDLRAPAIMTRSYPYSATQRVGFTPQTWVALAALCLAIITTVGGGLIWVVREVATMQQQVASVMRDVDRHDRQLEHLKK